MSTMTVSLTELRPKLPQILDRLDKYFDRCIITKHGKPEAVILSEEDYENLLETLDILSNQRLMREIKKAEDELKRGKEYVFFSVEKSELELEEVRRMFKSIHERRDERGITARDA